VELQGKIDLYIKMVKNSSIESLDHFVVVKVRDLLFQKV